MLTRKRAGWIAGLLLIAACLVMFAVRVRREMVDFSVNDKAGARMRYGETLYRASDGHYQFKYPPFAAMLYVPLAALPLPAAKAIWFVLILAATVAVFVLSLKLSGDRARGWAAWLDWVPLIVLGRYFLRELQLGQINALITFLLLAMTGLLVTAEEREAPRSELAAGILWGLSVALKPYALIFLPYLALKKKARALAAGVVTLAVAFLAPAFFYGFRGNLAVHREWVKSLSQSTPHLITSQDNVSLLAMFTKWTGRPDLAFRLWLVSIVLLGLFILGAVRRGRRLENPVALECGLLLLLIPLISPLGWDYTFLSSILAVALIARRFADYGLAGRVLLGAVFLVIPLSLYDLVGRAFYARFMALSVITVCFLVLTGYGLFLRGKELR